MLEDVAEPLGLLDGPNDGTTGDPSVEVNGLLVDGPGPLGLLDQKDEAPAEELGVGEPAIEEPDSEEPGTKVASEESLVAEDGALEG